MKIIDKRGAITYALKTQQLSGEQASALTNPLAQRIVKALSEESLYPKQLAKRIKMHEQNVYYYIHKLEKAKIIHVVKQERIQGTIAKFYTLSSDSFFIPVRNFKESTKLEESQSSFLSPFIVNGELNALIIVGSPDPHGPMKARSRDGYFGMDLALFLGTFLTTVPESKVKLDTEITDKDLKEHNLIVLGGPIVNKVAELIGKKIPVYYDEEKKGFYSETSHKLYVHEEIGVINNCKSPFNKEKSLLYIAGIRNFGTKAAILAFLKHFKELEKGNHYDKSVHSKVVEGIDLNSDGIVDDAEILE